MATSIGLPGSSLQGALNASFNSPPATKATAVATPAPPLYPNATALPLVSTHVDEMQRQLDELQRSVTVVFWYQANTEPVRIQHTLSTFPLFKLSNVAGLVADLGLTSTSYVDTYHPQSGKWEQHMLSSIRIVETQQRLLYRKRRSLVEGISDNECPGLHEEVENQIKSSAVYSASSTPRSAVDNTRKRAAPPIPASAPPAKQHISEAYYSRSEPLMPTTASPQQSSPALPPTPSSAPSLSPPTQTQAAFSVHPAPTVPRTKPDGYLPPPLTNYSSTSPAPASAPAFILNPRSPPAPIPYHPHPPLKRWPNDYTVSQITRGFNNVELLQNNQTSPMTQKVAFERVFGTRYVKSTVCRHRNVWRKAPHDLKSEFEAYGEDDERGIWGDFVRRVEGRTNGKPKLKSTSQEQGTALDGLS